MKSNHRYPKKRGSHYGMRPGLYVIDERGRPIRVFLTNWNPVYINGHLMIGNAEFTIPSGREAAVDKLLSKLADSN